MQWLFKKPFKHIIVWTNLLKQPGSKSERPQKLWSTFCAIIVIVFLILVDFLSMSNWTNFFKGHLRGVMLSYGILNDWGTIANPQTRNKLSFDGTFPMNIHCCQSEDSSAPLSFGYSRQRFSACYSCLFIPHLCIYVRNYMLNSHLLKQNVWNSIKFTVRAFFFALHA